MVRCISFSSHIWSTIAMSYQKNSLSISGADLCWALGGIICNFIPILPHFQHWGDEARPLLFSRKQIKWRPKKKGFTENLKSFWPQNQLMAKKRFSPKIEVFVPESQWRPKKSPKIIQRSDADHSQIIGEMQSNYWGDISPHFPRVSAPLLSTKILTTRSTDNGLMRMHCV